MENQFHPIYDYSFQGVSIDEAESIVNILEHAIDLHLSWVQEMHRCLIFNKPFSTNVCRENAHELCQLGTWYYNDAPICIRSLPAFRVIGKVHQLMHDLARHLATKAKNKEHIIESEYMEFSQCQMDLVNELTAFKENLLRILYSFDNLTGAINRKGFLLVAEKEHAFAQRNGVPYSLGMIDLDHFKDINDQYGHPAGDQVLRTISQLIIDRLRSSDCFGRYGGEEFIVFLPGTSVQNAHNVLDQIRGLIEQLPILIDDKTSINITASIGIAQFCQNCTLDEIIKRADVMLYEAKKKRNQTISAFSGSCS